MKLPHMHARFYCNGNDKVNCEKGYLKLQCPPPWVIPGAFELLKIGLFKSDTTDSNSLPHPGKVQIPNPWEGQLCQIPYFQGTDDSQMPMGFLGLGGGGGMLKLRIDQLIMLSNIPAPGGSFQIKNLHYLLVALDYLLSSPLESYEP